MAISCPACGKHLYRGSHRGTQAYKCLSRNNCKLSKTPIGRTKAEVRTVNAHLNNG